MATRRSFTIVITEKRAIEFERLVNKFKINHLVVKIREAFPEIFTYNQNQEKAWDIRRRVISELKEEFDKVVNQVTELHHEYNKLQSKRIKVALIAAGLEKFRQD